MKRQKELAKRVNEEAMKRFQDHKDEQISKRFAILTYSSALCLNCVCGVLKNIFLILCLTDQSCRRTLRTNMFRLFREMLRFKTSASLLVCSLVTQTLSFCDFTYPLSSPPLPLPSPPLSQDRKYEAIVLPVHGVPLPFHISTIKVLTHSHGVGKYTL